MSATPSRAPRALMFSICQTCRQRLLPSTTGRRAFSSTPSRAAIEDPLSGLMDQTMSRQRQPRSRSSAGTKPAARLTEILEAPSDSFLPGDNPLTRFDGKNAQEQPHRLHVYATKHNTHITLVQPAKPAILTASSGISRTSASAADQKKQIDVLLSLSAGNIGFRKAGRGSYDAAYQLGAFVCKQIQEKGMLRDIRDMQVVLRGFGAGREAVSKVLLGSEGRLLRGKIQSVVDATRLKQGGPRSKKPRRLG